MSPLALPAGWRRLTWVEEPPEEPPEPDSPNVAMPAMLVGYLQAASRMIPRPPEPLPILRRALICPAHEMPTFAPLRDTRPDEAVGDEALLSGDG